MFSLSHCGVVCAAGATQQELIASLFVRGTPTLRHTDAWSPGRVLPLGALDPDWILPSVRDWPVPFHSRNNQLALAALAQIRSAVDAAIATYGPARIGVVVGTSTSGIAETEIALRTRMQDGAWPDTFHYAQQELGAPARMLGAALQISGPCYVHSSACASSGKAMISAARLLSLGLCDAVVCGGVDTLCEFTVAGFSALESVSGSVCNPLSANRNGINIGEGAALFLMTRAGAQKLAGAAPVLLAGWGESSDAWHMSAPEPQGRGARAAMQLALRRAGLRPDQIDYINLHGTATVQNDLVESHAVADLFGQQVPVSSTKPFTGHALGAASALEAAICWLTLHPDNPLGRLPPHCWDGEQDPALPVLRTVPAGMQLGRPVQWALSNSFAFGGANATLLMGRGA